MSPFSLSRRWLGVAACSVLVTHVAVAQTQKAIPEPLTSPTPTSIEAGLTAYENGDFYTAYRALLPLAHADVSAAQYLVGLMMLEGRGVEANPHKGIEWLLGAATQDNLHAQQLLGRVYLNGSYGIEKNSALAAKWLKPSADTGDPVAQFDMALAYMMGGTLAPNPEVAFNWIQMAAQYGHADAEHLLARSYLAGYGVDKDANEAAVWFSKAARQGVAQSQNDLGSLYAQGLGVPKDLSMAMAWFSISESNGLEAAKLNKSRLEPALTNQQWEMSLRMEEQLRKEIRSPQETR